jgi:AcrR family transcriptional regulator
MPHDDAPLPSVWARPRAPRRPPALSREQIVTEAVRLLDSEGVDALSMRRLGARLDTAATSLYRHVASKEELIELAVDEVYGEMPTPGPGTPEGWRDAAAAGAREMRAVILRHPWIVSVLGEVGLAYLGPNMMRYSEGMLGVFTAAGFGLEDADRAFGTLSAYVVGTATGEAAWLVKLARSGRTEAEWAAGLWPAAEAAARPYPLLSAFYTALRGKPAPATRDADFDFGVARVLDGLEAWADRGGD